MTTTESPRQIDASPTLGRRRLEMAADRIEACLAGHKIAARVWGGRVGRHSVLFALSVANGNHPAQVLRLGDEIALSLGRPVIVHACGPWLRVRVFGLGGAL